MIRVYLVLCFSSFFNFACAQVKTKDGPRDWVIIEKNVSADENLMIFGKKGSFLHKAGYVVQGQPYWTFSGTWKMKGDSLFIQYKEKKQLMGQGTPLPPPPVIPGNYRDIYKEYKPEVSRLDSLARWHWPSFRKEIEDLDGPDWYRKAPQPASDYLKE